MSSPPIVDERSTLLHRTESQTHEHEHEHVHSKIQALVWGTLSVLLVAGIVVVFAFHDVLSYHGWTGDLPKDPVRAAHRLLEVSPVIDGHIDLPELARMVFANNVSAIDLSKEIAGHVDIPRLRKGQVGGFFWSVYVDCPKRDEEKDFLTSSWRVRDTLEQIDVARLLIAKYPETFQFALGTEDIKHAIRAGKIASLLGVEGAHQIGNSLAVLRQYYALGVRYMTLTHVCHNAFADSCGMLPGKEPLHHGLSKFGHTLIGEMNRLGMLVDLSHTSDATAAQALLLSKAPVIWSHSSARAVHDVPRNIPDSVLRLVGFGEGQNDAVIMVNFAPYFVAPAGKADVIAVANHVEHIANVAGRQHVGIGSDYDGIENTPVGLEDASKYPALIAELYKRGWNKYELSGLTGANLLRVFEGAERVKHEMSVDKNVHVAYDLYEKRADLPKWKHGEL